MQTVIEDQELDYFLDLSSINVIDDNGQIWVPDESMVDISIISSDPDVVWLNPDDEGSTGKIFIGKSGLATLEFSIWYEGNLIAADVKTFVVVESKKSHPIQELSVKLQNGDSTATSPDKDNVV